MAEMLSPGVFIQEIDASTIVPTVSNSIAVFCGDFRKGPGESYTLITSVADLISYYGEPTNTNYNDFYQAYNFLQYGNKLLVARAVDQESYNGHFEAQAKGDTITNYANTDLVAVNAAAGSMHVDVQDSSLFNIGDIITFDQSIEYTILSIDSVDNRLILSNALLAPVVENQVVDVVTYSTERIIAPTLTSNLSIMNYSDFETKESGIAFEKLDSKYKIIARNPGTWSNDIEIAIVTPEAFNANMPSYAFAGIGLDELYEYAPTGNEFGIIVKVGNEIVETWTVSSNPTAKDFNNKSMYVENVINNGSRYIFIKDNMAVTTPVQNYCYSVNETVIDEIITLQKSADGTIGSDDLLTAYELFENKEELDIDIVIGNELDGGISAKNLVEARMDCIAFIGAEYGDVVGQKSATATGNLVTWRKTGAGNFNSMFVVASGNYKYQYDRYADKYRWVNLAGDIAGLRAQTSMNRASWWASAGLERGQIKNVTKLAFNPTQGQRDLLYKNGINPVCTFPGQGTVMWGQKTLLDKPSSFDRVNVRGLFNTMERALAKMAKYQVMEFNDNFTRNRIISMIKPYLSSVQAGRGIQDFLVICDESNNTADIISRNQLIVDIYIKPTYVAEFIQLRFTNAGTNSFSEVIGG